jgi:ADP-ribose pyrophosphatase YjhB (NUDIX family)
MARVPKAKPKKGKVPKSGAPAKKPPPKPSNREPDREPRAQYAALPWRRNADGEVEVLLITSRETKRWVIPKGWPIVNMKSAKSAAQEAFEESGVLGKIAKSPIGAYAYDKRLRNGRLQHVRVTVFALQVDSEAETYPELGQRDKRWLPLAEAATLVEEPELMVVLATFKP